MRLILVTPRFCRMCADVLHRDGGVDDGTVLGCRLFHFRRPRRAAIAAHIDEINVPTLLGDVVHHRQAVQRQIERRLGGIRGTMDVEKNLVRRKTGDAGRMFVADVELNARIGGGNEIAFDIELRALGAGSRGQQNQCEAGQQRRRVHEATRHLSLDHSKLL
jgi:hypothetical protein